MPDRKVSLSVRHFCFLQHCQDFFDRFSAVRILFFSYLTGNCIMQDRNKVLFLRFVQKLPVQRISNDRRNFRVIHCPLYLLFLPEIPVTFPKAFLLYAKRDAARMLFAMI